MGVNIILYKYCVVPLVSVLIDVDDKYASELSNYSKVALRDNEGFVLAILEIQDIWQPDLKLEAQSVFRTNDIKHPGVNYLLKKSKNTTIKEFIHNNKSSSA